MTEASKVKVKAPTLQHKAGRFLDFERELELTLYADLHPKSSLPAYRVCCYECSQYE